MHFLCSTPGPASHFLPPSTCLNLSSPTFGRKRLWRHFDFACLRLGSRRQLPLFSPLLLSIMEPPSSFALCSCSTSASREISFLCSEIMRVKDSFTPAKYFSTAGLPLITTLCPRGGGDNKHKMPVVRSWQNTQRISLCDLFLRDGKLEHVKNLVEFEERIKCDLMPLVIQARRLELT